MDQEGLKSLVNITLAHLLNQQKRAQPGLDAIRKLRAQRAALDTLDRKSRPAAGLHSVRAIGADVRWRGWLDRQRREVNMHLSRALAEHDNIMRDLKTAQGRHDALVSLVDKTREDAKRRTVSDREARLLETGLRALKTTT